MKINTKNSKKASRLTIGDRIASEEIVQRITPIDSKRLSVKLFSTKYNTVRFAVWNKNTTIFMSKV